MPRGGKFCDLRFSAVPWLHALEDDTLCKEETINEIERWDFAFDVRSLFLRRLPFLSRTLDLARSQSPHLTCIPQDTFRETERSEENPCFEGQ